MQTPIILNQMRDWKWLRREEKERGEKAITYIFDKRFVQMFKDKIIFGKLSLIYPEGPAS